MFIKGDLIYLRAMEPQDVDLLYALENDREMWQVSQTQFPFSKYTIEQFVLDVQNGISVTQQVRFMICDVNTQMVVGTVDLFDYDALHRRAGVGIMIIKEYQQKGFANEALSLLSHYATKNLMLKQLFANIQMDNQRSIQLFEKNGFKKSGVMEAWLFNGNKWEDVVFMQKILS